MENNCGECRHLTGVKSIGICEKQGMPLCPAELPACSNFEQKVITNGDVIRKMSNEELVQILGCARHLETCIHMDDDYPCEKCSLDWLNAPADSEVDNG